jgi:hypothetical protein
LGRIKASYKEAKIVVAAQTYARDAEGSYFGGSLSEILRGNNVILRINNADFG